MIRRGLICLSTQAGKVKQAGMCQGTGMLGKVSKPADNAVSHRWATGIAYAIQRGWPGSLQAGYCLITTAFARGFFQDLRGVAQGIETTVRTRNGAEKSCTGTGSRNLRSAWLKGARWRTSSSFLSRTKSHFGTEYFQVCSVGFFWTASFSSFCVLH